VRVRCAEGHFMTGCDRSDVFADRAPALSPETAILKAAFDRPAATWPTLILPRSRAQSKTKENDVEEYFRR
jgi:hypothetical protein